MDIDKAFGKLYEEVKIDEAKEFWAIIDKAKGGEVMAISSDEKGAKSSVKMSNFSKHDYHFGKDPRTLKIVKVAGSYKQGEKMIGTKLSFKEDIEKAFKEFVEEIDERKMTDAEMAEREEIVKKMKPKLQSFKDRYGDDAKKVMYATATKQAMEEVEIEEKKSATGYELYHKTFSDAMQHAYAHAKSKGFVVDPKEIDDKVATGPKKPSSGKTNRYSLKAGRKKVEIQVANLDNKRYELNMYIEAVELDEAFSMSKGNKRVVDAFYDQKTIKAHGDSILTTDGKSLTKRGMGGQHIATWENGKIRITAVSDVKSTEQILRYMKKSIPKNNFKPEDYKRFFEEVEIDEKFAGWIAFHPTKDEKLEIKPKKGVIDSLYDAKQAAIKHWKLPKSKHSLLAIEPAQEAFELGEVKSDHEDEIAAFKAKGGKVKKLKPGKKFKSLFKQKGPKKPPRSEGIVEALKPADKKVIDAFYDKEELEGKLLYSDGDKLEKLGMGRDTVAVWKGHKIQITSQSAVRSDDEILRYMKKSIPKLNFDPKSYKKFFEGIDIEKASMGAVIKDFQDSDAPQFKGKSDKKRKEMAIAAKLSKEEKEETDDPKSKKKDKINLKPKMDETMKNYKEFMKKVKEKRFQSEDADADMKAAREKKERERKRAAASRQTDAYRGIEKARPTKDNAPLHKEDSDPDTKGTQGDNAEWKKARSAVLKKFGVGSCSALKDEKEKKACYKALDDSHVADHEEQVKKEEVIDVVSKILGRRKEVQEAVTMGGIEYGEQDWDVQHRLENSYPNLHANYAEFHEQGLEGPYLWHGETYFFDRKVGGWYSVTEEDFVDDEISKDLSLAYVKDGLYKRQFAS